MKLIQRLSSLLLIVSILVAPLAYAQDDVTKQLKESMKGRQQELSANYNAVSIRVNTLPPRDDRKKPAQDLLDLAKDAVDDFKGLDTESEIEGDPPVPSANFLQKEEAAAKAVAEVNRYLVSPNRPGNVPQGDLIEDFIPRIIRLLFQFTWVVMLITMVVSGVMMIISFDNEERVTKAKSALLWAIVGFAFVTLAFALVRGVTGITFF